MTATTPCGICHYTDHAVADCDLAELDSRKFHNVRTPATINPDDRDKWRGFAQSYAHLGRPLDLFVMHAAAYEGRRGRHSLRTLSRAAIDAEVAAFRAEHPDIFPKPASQPLPMVRFSQAGVQSVAGRL